MCKKFFYKIIQGKMVLADLNRRVEFVDKLLFMGSLVTGWKMLWENGGKEVFLFPCIIHLVINDEMTVYP